MKAPFVLIAALGCLAAGAALADETDRTGAVEVIYSHPENFTDVKDNSSPTNEGRDGILDVLRRYIVAEAGRYLPAGDKFTMTFTDIDLAGDFEPWRGPQFDNVRVIKPIYPPAFKFSYTVTDSRGTIVKQGQESIRDLNFQERAAPDTDPLRYEKSILGEWIANNLKGLK